MRIRSLRHDAQKNEAYYSAWTAWKSGRVQPGTDEIRAQLDQVQELLDILLEQHLTGDL